MSGLASKIYFGVDLGLHGLCTAAVSGVHDLAPDVADRQWVRGSDVPSDTVTRAADLVPMRLACVVAASSHSALVTQLKALRRRMSPRLGWGEFRIEDRPGERTLAKSKGFPVGIDSLPFDACHVELDWQLERLGWWEDTDPRDVTDPASVDNDGDFPCWPLITLTATAAVAGGFSCTVGDKTWRYAGDVISGDVLVVHTEAMTCTKNDVLAMENVDDGTDWPALVPGANAVSKSSPNLTLGVSFRRRWE